MGKFKFIGLAVGLVFLFMSLFHYAGFHIAINVTGIVFVILVIYFIIKNSGRSGKDDDEGRKSGYLEDLFTD